MLFGGVVQDTATGRFGGVVQDKATGRFGSVVQDKDTGRFGSVLQDTARVGLGRGGERERQCSTLAADTKQGDMCIASNIVCDDLVG